MRPRALHKNLNYYTSLCRIRGCAKRDLSKGKAILHKSLACRKAAEARKKATGERSQKPAAYADVAAS